MRWGIPLSASILAAALLAAPLLQAQALLDVSGRDIDGAEQAAIDRRQQWFVESRGLAALPDATGLRAEALDQQRSQLASRTPALLAATDVWQPLGPDSMTMLGWTMGRVAGRVTALAVRPGDEDVLYLGTAAGGFWRTADGGATWVSLFDAVGTPSIGSILLEPGTPDTLWVGTGEPFAGGCVGYFGLGLFRSTDGGASFEPRNGAGPATLELSFVQALARSDVDGSALLAGGRGRCDANGSSIGSGIYRSVDDGATWTQVLAAGAPRDLIQHPTDDQRVYAAVTSAGIYRSIDAGLTWSQLANGLPVGSSAGAIRLALSESNPAVLYALSGSSDRLYRSSDGGDSWTTVNTNACEGQCTYNLTIDVHPTDPDRVLVGTIRPALSGNGGATLTTLTTGWGSAQTVHQDIHVVRWSRSDGNRFWVGSDGGLWRTDNGGSAFSNRNANLNITQYYDVAIDPGEPTRVYGGAQDNSSSVRNAGQLWAVTIVTGDGFMNLVDPGDTNRVFQTSYPSGGTPSLVLSTSRGAPSTFSWVETNGITAGEPFPWVTPLAITAGTAFVASNRVYRGATAQSAFAFTWTAISDNLTGTSSALSVVSLARADGVAPLPACAGSSNGRVQCTPDVLAATPAWTNVTGNYPGGYVSDVAIDPLDPQRVFVTRGAFGQSRLYRSSVGGTTWDAVGAGLPNVPANAVAIDSDNPNRIFVGTDVGVYESLDNGDSFVPFMTQMPLGMVVTDLELNAQPHVLVAGTYGRGAWLVELYSDRVFSDGYESP